jgi:protein-tyrosine phosphatase
MAEHRMARLGAGALVALALVAVSCGDDDAAEPADTTGAAAATTAEATNTTAAPAEAVRFVAASVERQDDGRLLVAWELDGEGPVEVSWGADPDAPDEAIETVDGASEVLVDDPSGGGRPYFRLTAAGDAVTVAERRIALEGQPNFRDLGGYETADGRRVRWGRLYRSGELGELTEADVAYLTDVVGVRLVCDLRSPGEVAELADVALGDAERVEIPIYDDSVDPVAIEEGILAGDLSVADPELLVDGNRRFVTDMTAEYAELMARVMDPANHPTNLHCTAGKDRAGWGAAVILLALGVPEETVMEDYLLSGVYRAEENEATLTQVRTVVAAIRGIDPAAVPDADLDGLRALIDVRPEFLQAAFDAVTETYGDVATYLTEGLGLTPEDLEAFRDEMLE